MLIRNGCVTTPSIPLAFKNVFGITFLTILNAALTSAFIIVLFEDLNSPLCIRLPLLKLFHHLILQLLP